MDTIIYCYMRRWNEFFLCFRVQVRANYSCLIYVRNSVVIYLLLQYFRESHRQTYVARTTMYLAIYAYVHTRCFRITLGESKRP